MVSTDRKNAGSGIATRPPPAAHQETALYSSDRTLRITFMGESATVALQVSGSQRRLCELLKELAFRNLRHAIEVSLADGAARAMRPAVPDEFLAHIDLDEIFKGRTRNG